MGVSFYPPPFFFRGLDGAVIALDEPHKKQRRHDPQTGSMFAAVAGNNAVEPTVALVPTKLDDMYAVLRG